MDFRKCNAAETLKVEGRRSKVEGRRSKVGTGSAVWLRPHEVGTRKLGGKR
ncbi:MAG: hypothetical protein Q7R22_013830 [Verrucomicrobiota bacterium JB025]|nr:hypothetical protein [Verrucomicrobiota bacterium JB025]